MRASGILLPVFSLPSHYGIGCFSREAYEFVYRLEDAKQKYWQILPLGPTGLGDSPYAPLSCFAGNPYFIDLNILVRKGLLTRKELSTRMFGIDPCSIDYAKLSELREKVLRRAFMNFEPTGDFMKFKYENASWLDDHALFMAVKDKFGGASWSDWDNDIKTRKPDALKRYTKELSEDIEFYKWEQYEFDLEWFALKKHANAHGIEIIGDMPIYTAYDSSDCWANSYLFMLDKNKNPISVAGCPPDDYSPDGQLWGNPIYNWNNIRRHSYRWWISRIRQNLKFFDIVRLDHYRGFDSFYSIPMGETTARHGTWNPGPGMSFFNYINKTLGRSKFIAEDLGFLDDSVRDMIRQSGTPGMKVLQFAFEDGPASEYLPHNYPKNCVAYTGTHDNDTARGWYSSLSSEGRRFFRDYTGRLDINEADVAAEMIGLVQRSPADTCIIPFQDILGLGSEARTNIPGTIEGDWRWRMKYNDFSSATAKRTADMTEACGRAEWIKEKKKANEKL